MMTELQVTEFFPIHMMVTGALVAVSYTITTKIFRCSSKINDDNVVVTMSATSQDIMSLVHLALVVISVLIPYINIKGSNGPLFFNL